MEYWNILGISPTTDRKVVKKAYSALLKKTRPDKDPEGYQQLREAFDWAVGYCKYMASQEEGRGNSSVSEDQSDQTNSSSGEGLIDVGGEALVSHNTEVAIESSQESKKELVARMVANTKAQIDSKDREGQAEQPIDLNTEAVAQREEEKKKIEQRAYEDALSAMQSIFEEESSDAGLKQFSKLIEGADLLNLKTRAYFEAMLLNTLSNYEGGDLPYELVFSAAEEFHWFEEQHAHPEKRQRVAYLQARLNTHRSYTNGLIYTSQAGESGEREAAKILLGKFRPWYFHFLRFIGNYNRSARKFTRYFRTAVENNLCPELDTPTFHWWNKNLERSLFSLWHILVGGILTVVASPIISSEAPVVSEKYFAISSIGLVVLTSLIVWGLDVFYMKLSPIVFDTWHRIKGLRSTETVLSFLAIVSILIWRRNQEVEYTNWLIVLSLATSVLLFGLEGVIMMLGASAIFGICYAIVDVLGNYPHLLSYALVIGFLSQKLFLISLEKIPARAQRYIVGNAFLKYCFAGIIALSLSLLFLFVTTL